VAEPLSTGETSFRFGRAIEHIADFPTTDGVENVASTRRARYSCRVCGAVISGLVDGSIYGAAANTLEETAYFLDLTVHSEKALRAGLEVMKRKRVGRIWGWSPQQSFA
jgi:hypothetical protein